MRHTDAHVGNLGPNEIFVFGSNEAGQHGGGAAAHAHAFYGAQMGVREGITGYCYAFPTLNKELKKRTAKQLFISVAMFKATARSMPELTFLLTKVGCGIAGYPEEDMIALFKDCPKNVVKPVGW